MTTTKPEETRDDILRQIGTMLKSAPLWQLKNTRGLLRGMQGGYHPPIRGGQ